MTRSIASLIALTFFIASIHAADTKPPEGFTSLFNGKDLSG